MKPAHARIVCPVSFSGARPEAHLLQMGHAGLRLSVAQITLGPLTIETGVDTAFPIPASLTLIQQAVSEGADAKVIDWMGDPGLRPERSWCGFR